MSTTPRINVARLSRALMLAGLATTAIVNARAADDIKVYLLGTGSPTPNPARFSMSTLIEAGGQRLLFDMGRGNVVRLSQFGIPLGSINAHFITHMHSDHVGGLPDLWLTGWLRSPYAQRTSAMVIYGPKGTVDMMKHLREAFSEDIRIREEDEHNTEDGIAVDAHDIEAGFVYEKNGVRVRSFDSNHGEHIKPNFGYKITYKGMSVVLSGDTKYDPAVEREATGVNLLIHEVAMITPRLLAVAPNYKEVLAHHTTPEEAGRLFTNAHPGMAVFSHISAPSDPGKGVAAPSADDIVAATRTTYAGPLTVGADMMTLLVTPDGVMITAR